MKTLMTSHIFNINISETDKIIIKDLQNKYSKLYRILFNNQHFLENKDKISSLRSYYNFSAKFMEYVIIDVKTFIAKEETRRRKIKNKIEKLNKTIANIERRTKNKTIIKKLKELNYDLKRKQKELISEPVFGGKQNLRQISKLKNIKNRTTIEQQSLENHLKDYKDYRLRYLIFEGECSRKGNRFFDLKNLSKGEILFKFENSNIKIPLKFHFKSKERQKDYELIEKFYK